MSEEIPSSQLGKWDPDQLKKLEAIALAAKAWVEWDWNPNTSGVDMELDDIQGTCERLKTNLEKSLKNFFGSLYAVPKL